MAKIFDDPRQQAMQEDLESTCPQCGHDERTCGCMDEEREEEEETLSLCESFHFLLCSDQPDPEWEEIHRRILAGARPADEVGPSCGPLAAALIAAS